MEISKEELAQLIAMATTEAIKAAKKEEGPGIVAKFYFGAKAGVKAITSAAEEAAERIKDAAELEMEITEKEKEMEEVLKQLRKDKKALKK